MTIQTIDNQIIITLPASVGKEGLERLVNYLLYKEATKDSRAKPEEVSALARQVNREWWQANKHRFSGT